MAETKEKVLLKFEITMGDGTREETISQDIVKIGKDPKAHLRLDDPRVSRMHAVIEVTKPSELNLIDLGNDPATLVNGQKVNKAKLKEGDIITIADTIIKLVSVTSLEQQEPVAAAVPPPMPGRPAAPAAAPANPFAIADAPAANPFAAAGAAASNPFAAKPEPTAAHQPLSHGLGGKHGKHKKDPEGSYTYRLIKSGPEVPAAEVENPLQMSVEVVLMWGTNVLSVRTLNPPRDFYVADEVPPQQEKDMFMVPAKSLGSLQVPVVLVQGGNVMSVIPAGCKATFEVPDHGKLSLAEAASQRLLQPCSQANQGGQQFVMSKGARSTVEFGAFSIRVTVSNAARKLVAPLFDEETLALAGYFGATILVLAGVMVAMWAYTDPLANDENQEIDKTTTALLLQAQKKAREREMPEQEDEAQQNQTEDHSGGTGEKHKGEEGMAGKSTAQVTGGYYQIKGPPDNPQVRLARVRAAIENNNYGAIGALNQVFGSTAAMTAFDSDSPISSGRDPNDFQGNITGDHPGDSFGYGGLGQVGTGSGGGGWGDGMGLGTVGGFGHGSGTGTGQGYGSGGGRIGGGRKARAPTLLQREDTISGGKLPPEVVRRVIRANFPRFRQCYEIGLRQDPEMKGVVGVKFIIGEDGAVESAFYSDGTLPNATVQTCVVGVYRTLSFPPPEGGKVAVHFPIDFQNNEQ